MDTRDWLILAAWGVGIFLAVVALYAYIGGWAVLAALAAYYLIGSEVTAHRDRAEAEALAASLDERD